MSRYHVMITKRLTLAGSLSAILATTSPGLSAQTLHEAPADASAADFIEIFEKLSGKQPGIRKGHARGVCATGDFVPSDMARERFSSTLFQQPVPLVIRFSMAGGNPQADERAIAPRGIGVQFQLPDRSAHNIAGLTTPVFAGRTPQQFLGLLRVNHAIQQGQASSDDRTRYLQANPEAARQGSWLQTHPPAPEYTAATYFGIHTFLADGAEGNAIAFRWRLVPRAGERSLTEKDRAGLTPSFLEERLERQLSDGNSVELDWHWVMAAAEDDINDPSVQWPSDRETVEVGTVTLKDAGGDACTAVNYDPNRLAAGIAPSDDPVLALRSAAYAISFGKRMSSR